jgi:CRP/FNR family transcriptional regulator
MLVTTMASYDDPSRTDTGSSSLPRSAPPETFAQGLIGGQLRTFEAKEHLYREGDRATHVYKIEAGHVCIYRMMADGRRQVLDFADPGDLIGLGAIGNHHTNALATARTRVRCLPVSDLHQVVQSDAGLGLKLYEAMSRELHGAQELLFTVSQRNASERLAAFLIALAHRNERKGDSRNEFVLPMTRTDIADFLGLTIETVSRTITKFRADGLIDVSHCVLVKILDAPALAALAHGRAAATH